MGGRRRAPAEATTASSAPYSPEPQTLLQRVRNTWEFANLFQFVYIFGPALKLGDRFDIEDLERECCKPEQSKVLDDLALSLLKLVSSHRGLTPEIFDEYTRRQYLAKAPLKNPFGDDDEPLRFSQFDIFTKLKVLVQLSVWVFHNPDRIRERMEERSEIEQAIAWRVNIIGWDRQDRAYYVLDDNRLYRQTDPPVTESSSRPRKAPDSIKSKKGRPRPKGSRKSNRTRILDSDESAEEAVAEMLQDEDAKMTLNVEAATDECLMWECVAITLSDYTELLSSFKGSRHPDEKALYKQLTTDILPVIETAEATQARRRQKEERELFHVQLLAGAKRSSRIEGRLERERQEREAEEAIRQQKADLLNAQLFEKRQMKMEADRQSRMMTREHRLKERETKRILHEDAIARISAEEKKLESGESRLSERHLKAEMERKKQELAALQEETDWTFDCSKCGKFGTNLDDGTHSVACERCSVWQHSACLGILEADAEANDFHFICQDCIQREKDAKRPKIPSLKFRVGTMSPEGQPIGQGEENQATKRKVNDELGVSETIKVKKRKTNATNGHSMSASPTALATQPLTHDLCHGNGHIAPHRSLQSVSGFTFNNDSALPVAGPAQQLTEYRPLQPVPAAPAVTTPRGWSAQYIPTPSVSHGLPPSDHNPFANTFNDAPVQNEVANSVHRSTSAYPRVQHEAKPRAQAEGFQTPSGSFSHAVAAAAAAAAASAGMCLTPQSQTVHEPGAIPAPSPTKTSSPLLSHSPPSAISRAPVPTSNLLPASSAMPITASMSMSLSPNGAKPGPPVVNSTTKPNLLPSTGLSSPIQVKLTPGYSPAKNASPPPPHQQQQQQQQQQISDILTQSPHALSRPHATPVTSSSSSTILVQAQSPIATHEAALPAPTVQSISLPSLIDLPRNL